MVNSLRMAFKKVI